jgi:Cu/Ag efflux protein CusF
MTRRVQRTAAGCAMSFMVAGLWLGGCDRSPPAGGTAATQATLAAPDQTYTVRGRIVDLPDAVRPASSFQVRHEAIDDFMNAEGHVVGMDAMVMPFTPARELSLEGFAPGDVVELVFEVRWKTLPRSRVTELRRLPPDTPLEFREARPSR